MNKTICSTSLILPEAATLAAAKVRRDDLSIVCSSCKWEYTPKNSAGIEADYEHLQLTRGDVEQDNGGHSIVGRILKALAFGVLAAR